MKEFSPQAESTVRIPKDFDTSKFLEAEGHEWGGLYRLEPSPGTEAADSDEGEQLVRLDFILYEQFRMLGGLIDKKFSLVGCQLADPNKGVLFYESYCEEQVCYAPPPHPFPLSLW